MVSSASRFCRACGDTLPHDAAFCPACGTAVDSATPSAAAIERACRTSDSQFRRRVEKYRAHGWTVERELEDRVVLVDRGFGSVLVHVALFPFTQGVGNLLYAGYCYGPGAPRRELRVDGTTRSLGEQRGRVGGIDVATASGVVVGFAGLALVAALVAQGVLSWSVVVLLVTTLVLFGVLASTGGDDRESLTTFGRKRTLSERAIGDVPEACADCDGVVLDGVERRFAERTYVAGIPVRTHESGSNRYCRACATDDEFQVAGYDSEAERELA